MVDIPEPQHYSVGEMVVYKGQLHCIDNIQRTHLGYQCYTVSNVKTREFFHVPKHVLSKPVVQDLVITDANKEVVKDLLLTDINWDDSFDELLSSVAGNPPPEVSSDPSAVGNYAATVQSATSTRHATLDDDAIDEIAKARISHNNEKQTKWVVTLFKGMFLNF